MIELQLSDPLNVAILFVGLLLGGILKGATGAGLPIIGIPVIASVFDIRVAVILLALPNFFTNLWQIILYRQHNTEPVLTRNFAIAGGLGAGGQQDAWGGVLGATQGLMTEFGRERVIDTPISESAFIGAAAGAAATGLRPVAQLMFVDFFGVCGDQIVNQMAKFRYMFGGKAKTPAVINNTATFNICAIGSSTNISLKVVMLCLPVTCAASAK